MNPYHVLGVPQDAADHQIKMAYRAKARETHPDAGGDGDKFAEVSRAYAVLMDPEVRRRFDETGNLDEVPQFTVRQRMIEMLAAMFSEALAVIGRSGRSLKEVDLMGEMRKNIHANVSKVRNNHQGLLRDIQERQEMLSRITRPDDGENIFAAIIDAQLKELDIVVRKSDLNLRAIEMARDEIEFYKSEVELVRAMQMAQFGGNFTSSSSAQNPGNIVMQTWRVWPS